jgi:hypothetical protein
MNLEGIFEDLEAQFDAQLGAANSRHAFDESNLVTVWSRDAGTVCQLAAAILGVDFVAGMALGTNCFRLIPLVSVRNCEFATLKDASLPKCRFVEIEAAQFLARLPLPFSIEWRTSADAPLRHGNVSDLLGQCLCVEELGCASVQAVPIHSLEFLELSNVENFGDLP